MRARARKLMTLTKYRAAHENQSARDLEMEAREKAADAAIRAAEELSATVLEQVREALGILGPGGKTVHREPLRSDYEERYGA